jgi:hypothetical protein
MRLNAESPLGVKTAGDRLKIDRGTPVRLFRCRRCGTERYEGWIAGGIVGASIRRAEEIRESLTPV